MPGKFPKDFDSPAISGERHYCTFFYSVTQIFSCVEIGDLSHEKGFISPTSLRKIERLAGLSEAKMTQVSERFLHEEQVNRVRLRIDSEQKGKAY